MTRDEFIKNQKQYCRDNNTPFFIPSNGICYKCKEDIVQYLIDHELTGKEYLITGCPICYYSYCE